MPFTVLKAPTRYFEVLFYDNDETQTKKAFQTIQDRLHRYVNENKLSQDDIGTTISKIKIFKNLEDLSKSDIIIENVPENEKIKMKVFKEII